MVPRKSWVLAENFGPISKSRKSFLMRLEVSFLRLFASPNLEFFGRQVFVFFILSFSEVEFFTVHGYNLLN